LYGADARRGGGKNFRSAAKMCDANRRGYFALRVCSAREDQTINSLLIYDFLFIKHPLMCVPEHLRTWRYHGCHVDNASWTIESRQHIPTFFSFSLQYYRQ
jgi:hypothetical protein